MLDGAQALCYPALHEGYPGLANGSKHGCGP
jgi:hypothetical protein